MWVTSAAHYAPRFHLQMPRCHDHGRTVSPCFSSNRVHSLALWRPAKDQDRKTTDRKKQTETHEQKLHRERKRRTKQREQKRIKKTERELDVEEKTRKARDTFGKGILISFPPTRPQTQPNQTHKQKGKQRKKRKTEREREIKKEEVELERRWRGSREHKKKGRRQRKRG